MNESFTPGTRVTCTGTAYGHWIGESGTVEATPPECAAYDTPEVVWVYMDFQAEEHARLPQYARPVPVGLDPGQLVPAAAPVKMCACGHPKDDHACRTNQGVCFTCYEASNHGQLPYCNRYRVK